MIFNTSKISKSKNMQSRIRNVLTTSLCIPLMRQKWRENSISFGRIYVQKGVFALDNQIFIFQILRRTLFTMMKQWNAIKIPTPMPWSCRRNSTPRAAKKLWSSGIPPGDPWAPTQIWYWSMVAADQKTFFENKEKNCLMNIYGWFYSFLWIFMNFYEFYEFLWILMIFNEFFMNFMNFMNFDEFLWTLFPFVFKRKRLLSS